MITGTKHTLKARRAIARAMKKAIANKKRSIAQKKLAAERKAKGLPHTNGRPYRMTMGELKECYEQQNTLGLHKPKTDSSVFLDWAKNNLHPAVYGFLSANPEAISSPTPRTWTTLSRMLHGRDLITKMTLTMPFAVVERKCKCDKH